jgi:hypothetical protein
VDPGDQLAQVVGLDEVVVGSEVEAVHPGPQVGAGRRDEDRHLRRAADAGADLEPVDVGQPEVEQHDVRGPGAVLEALEGVVGGADPAHVEPVPAQHIVLGGRHPVVVLHQQEPQPTSRGQVVTSSVAQI